MSPVLDKTAGELVQGLEPVHPGQHLQCNLCGSEDTSIILQAAKRIHAPQHLVIYRYCRDCSFVSLDLDYDAWLATYAQGPEAQRPEDLAGYARQQREETESVIREISKVDPEILTGRERLLADIGAGAGGALSAYQALGWRTVGVEIGRPQSLFARRTLGMDVRGNSYDRSSFQPESLDFIHCYHTLEHLPQPCRTLNDFYAHLKPGGGLYVEVPNLLDTSVYQLGFGHVSLFSPGTLRQALTSCGFQAIHLFDRSRFPTYGIGALCRKPSPAARPAGAEPTLPRHRLSGWRRDPKPILRWKLWYGFHAGRGREAFTPMALLGLLRCAARKVRSG